MTEHPYVPGDGDSVTSALDLSSIDRVDRHTRVCLFWQSDADPETLTVDAGFEKEAWLSMVLLEWGVCGQIAERFGRPAGTVLYAPPGMVGRARTFPSGPPSADAILLADLHTDTDLDPSTQISLRSTLLAAAIGDLMRRGVRAVETYACRGDQADKKDAEQSAGFAAAKAVQAPDCTATGCMHAPEFFLDRGFTIEQDDPRFPRMRLEISADHLWQADVEHALDQLFIEAAARISERESLQSR